MSGELIGPAPPSALAETHLRERPIHTVVCIVRRRADVMPIVQQLFEHGLFCIVEPLPDCTTLIHALRADREAFNEVLAFRAERLNPPER